jgi:hypothetical protein
MSSSAEVQRCPHCGNTLTGAYLFTLRWFGTEIVFCLASCAMAWKREQRWAATHTASESLRDLFSGAKHDERRRVEAEAEALAP